jgi:hypothetical protein
MFKAKIFYFSKYGLCGVYMLQMSWNGGAGMG